MLTPKYAVLVRTTLAAIFPEAILKTNGEKKDKSCQSIVATTLKQVTRQHAQALETLAIVEDSNFVIDRSGPGVRVVFTGSDDDNPAAGNIERLDHKRPGYLTRVVAQLLAVHADVQPNAVG